MATYDYAAKAAMAAAKIAKYGREAVFVAENGQYDPVRSEISPECSRTKAMALMCNVDEKAIAAGAAQYGDMVLLVAGSDLPRAPGQSDLVELGGESWRVVSVNTVAPGGEAVLYKVQIRRS